VVGGGGISFLVSCEGRRCTSNGCSKMGVATKGVDSLIIVVEEIGMPRESIVT